MKMKMLLLCSILPLSSFAITYDYCMKFAYGKFNDETAAPQNLVCRAIQTYTDSDKKLFLNCLNPQTGKVSQEMLFPAKSGVNFQLNARYLVYDFSPSSPMGAFLLESAGIKPSPTKPLSAEGRLYFLNQGPTFETESAYVIENSGEYLQLVVTPAGYSMKCF